MATKKLRYVPDSEESPDWMDVRALAKRIERGTKLTLTSRVIGVLRRSAGEVAISADEVETALRNVTRATALLRKVVTRINRGSRRLSRALSRMYRLRDDGDVEGARRQIRDVLRVEVVQFYRKIAQGQLDQLDDWKRPKRNPLGKPLEPPRPLPKMRIPKWSDRCIEIMRQAVAMRDAGDLDGARQLLHDALAVERVPFYRKMFRRVFKSLDYWTPPERTERAGKAPRKRPARTATTARKSPVKKATTARKSRPASKGRRAQRNQSRH